MIEIALISDAYDVSNFGSIYNFFYFDREPSSKYFLVIVFRKVRSFIF